MPFYDGHGSKREVKFIVDFVDNEIYRKTGFQEKILIQRVDPNAFLNSTQKRIGATISKLFDKIVAIRYRVEFQSV